MDITTLVERELDAYAGGGTNGRAVLTRSAAGDEFLLGVPRKKIILLYAGEEAPIKG